MQLPVIPVPAVAKGFDFLEDSFHSCILLNVIVCRVFAENLENNLQEGEVAPKGKSKQQRRKKFFFFFTFEITHRIIKGKRDPVESFSKNPSSS